MFDAQKLLDAVSLVQWMAYCYSGWMASAISSPWKNHDRWDLLRGRRRGACVHPWGASILDSTGQIGLSCHRCSLLKCWCLIQYPHVLSFFFGFFDFDWSLMSPHQRFPWRLQPQVGGTAVRAGGKREKLQVVHGPRKSACAAAPGCEACDLRVKSSWNPWNPHGEIPKKKTWYYFLKKEHSHFSWSRLWHINNIIYTYIGVVGLPH